MVLSKDMHKATGPIEYPPGGLVALFQQLGGGQMADIERLSKDTVDKYRQLAEHYVMYGDKLDALRHVGYSESYARARGYTIFAREDVQAYIEEFRADVKERHLVTADKVINEMAKLAFVDVTEVVKVVKEVQELDDYSTREYLRVQIKPTDEWTPEQKAAVKSIKYTNNGIAVEFYSKEGMLTKLGETLGIFKQNLNVNGKVETGQEDPFKELKTEDLKALIASKGSG